MQLANPDVSFYVNLRAIYSGSMLRNEYLSGIKTRLYQEWLFRKENQAHGREEKSRKEKSGKEKSCQESSEEIYC